ncbi:hypothetical protein ABXS75_11870 [Roseburia hominis]
MTVDRLLRYLHGELLIRERLEEPYQYRTLYRGDDVIIPYEVRSRSVSYITAVDNCIMVTVRENRY